MSCGHNKNNIFFCFAKPLLIYSLPPVGDSCHTRPIDKTHVVLQQQRQLRCLVLGPFVQDYQGRKMDYSEFTLEILFSEWLAKSNNLLKRSTDTTSLCTLVVKSLLQFN